MQHNKCVVVNYKFKETTKMKSIVMYKEGGPEVFVLEDSPKPVAQDGEVIVKVHGTAATPSELLWWPTWNTMEGTPRQKPIPAHEFSGIVDSVADGMSEFKVGDQVYGINGWFKNGSLAEFVAVLASEIAIKPKTVSHILAGVTPLSALTAYQGIVTKGKVSNGETVLIHGASGAVGSFAVQFASLLGAKVVAVASRENAKYLKSLGADVVIDYKTQKFEDHCADVDFILDLVGGELLERSIAFLGVKGRLFSLATSSKETEYFFYVAPNTKDLSAIAKLIDDGKLSIQVDSVFPLERAKEAYKRKPQNGKVAISIDKG